MPIHRSLIVVAILAVIALLAAWSKLRFVDDADFAPQRIPLNQHPAFQANDR